MPIFNRGRSHSTAVPYAAASPHSMSSFSLVDRTLSAPTTTTTSSKSPINDLLLKNPDLLARLYDALSDNSLYPPDYANLVPLMPRYAIHPRPEEGNELLPAYKPSVYLESVMCCKLELNTPYLPATTRSWTLVYVQLNNTQLNIYHLAPTHARSALKRKLSTLPAHVSDPIVQTNQNPHSLPGTVVENGAFQVGKLIRSYTLQFAEVGLASDYKKRPNVFRVRAETEQFLFQAATQQQQVTWVNTVQMGIDVALPLEERALPKYRMIPRRRRRDRSGNTTTTTTRTTTAGASGSRARTSDRDIFARIFTRLRSNSESKPNSAPSAEVAAPSTATDNDSAAVSVEATTTPGRTTAVTDSLGDEQQEQLQQRRVEVPVADGDTHGGADALALANNTNNGADEGSGSGCGSEEEEMYGDDDDDEEEEEEEEEDLIDLISEYSMPSSQSTYSGTSSANSSDMDIKTKWEPDHPEQSHRSLLKYAFRCLVSLPASQSWLEKPVVHNGRKYIVRRDTLERVPEAVLS